LSAVVIARPGTDDEILATRELMLKLRPNVPPDEYLTRIRRMMQRDGYRLVMLTEHGRVRAVAGFRFMEMLYTGRILYVDDLITDESQRSRGFGKALLDWLKDRAREHGSEELHLDSGVQRNDAHRFYFRERMVIGAYHFRVPL
jgi:GNAT superfamily N-acetyltransferase